MSSQDAMLSQNQWQEERRQRLHLLYSDNHPWLHGWLCKKLGCACKAEDVAHNTFLRLLTLSSLNHIREPRAFLTTTASRLMIDEARRKQHERRYLEAHKHHAEEALVPSAESLALLGEQLTRVVHMLESLPDKCQRAFAMSKFDGMQYDGIARALGVSKSRVQQYMTRVKLAYYQLSYDD